MVERFPRPSELPEPEWRIFHDDELASRLSADIEQVTKGGLVKILCGPAHRDVYGPRFKSAVELAVQEKSATVKVVTGPLVIESGERNVILSLADQGLLQVAHRTRLWTDYHFHLVESDEAPGGYLAILRGLHTVRPHERSGTDFSGVGPEVIREYGERLEHFFDVTIDQLDYLRRMGDPAMKMLPIFVTATELDLMRRVAKNKGTWERLEPEALLRLREKVRTQLTGSTSVA